MSHLAANKEPVLGRVPGGPASTCHTPYQYLPAGSSLSILSQELIHAALANIQSAAVYMYVSQLPSKMIQKGEHNTHAKPWRLQLEEENKSAIGTAVDCTAQCMQLVVTTAGRPTGLSAQQN